jgi:hypothetical protein
MLEFKPTMTIDQLLANNTSAADTFPGWPNGVPAPSAVGLAPIDCPQVKLVHRCDWWDTGPGRRTSHPDIGIRSYDPAYCAKTVADMKARGLDGCTLDWYGKGSYEDKSALALKVELERQGLKFAITIDGGNPALKAQAEDTAATIAIFDYLNAAYFTSPAYLKYQGRPVVLFFGPPTCDWLKVRAHIQSFPAGNPSLWFRWDSNYGLHAQADGLFGWTHCDPTWIANVTKYGKPVMLGVNPRFDNTHREAPVSITWGTPYIIKSNGGLRWLSQIVQAKAAPLAQFPFIHIATWNDDQEGSGLESGITSDVTIALQFNDAPNTLSWNDPGPVFNHLTLYLTDDGKRLMPIADGIRGVTEVPLGGYGIPVGAWRFLVAAIGKNSIQNIVSNPVSASEFTDWK